MVELEIAIVLIMIALNGLFAAYEIALASVSKSRLHLYVTERKPGAAAAWDMKQRFERSLAGIQVGVTLVGAVAAAVSGAIAETNVGPYMEKAFGAPPWLAESMAITAVVVPLTVLTLLFGELLPKVFAFRHKERVCLGLSSVVRLFVQSVWPLVWVLERAVTAAMNCGERYFGATSAREANAEMEELRELRALVALARTSGLVGMHQEKIILNAASLSDRPIRQVMLPATAISMLDVNASLAEALIAAHLDMHTRFPVTERPGDVQAIIGYVNFKDIVATLRQSPQEPTLRSIVRDLPSLPDEMSAASCLEYLIRHRAHIALVRNAERQVIGMVTLEDIIEELVGEIEDEYDRLPAYITRCGTGWIVGGGVSLGKIREHTGIELPYQGEEPVPHNFNEWVTRCVHHSPQSGQVLTASGLHIVIRKTRRQKIQEAFIQSAGPM